MLGLGLGINKVVTIIRNFFSNEYSIYLDGVNEYIDLDSIIPDLTSTTTGTWSLWVKPINSTPASVEMFMSTGDTNDSSFIYFGLFTNGKLAAYSLDNGSQRWQMTTNNSPLTDNTWAHIALVQDGVEPKIYVNGVEEASIFVVSTDKTEWFNSIPGLDNFRIGSLNRNSFGDNFNFNGNVDEVYVFDTDLSASDISNIYNSGSPKDETSRSNIVGYWRMGDNPSDNWNTDVVGEWAFIDGSGNNNDIETVNCEFADVELDTP